jgi:transcription elongation factor Elf1
MRNNEDRFGANLQSNDVSAAPQSLEQQASTPINFIALTEYIPLPSKGKLYPKQHPLHNKESIEIKQMTAKEEDILTSRSLLKKGLALDKLIESLVVDKSINTDTLIIEDRNAIIIAARITAYGSAYDTTVTCPSCNEKVKNTFNLNEKLDTVEQRDMTAEINEDGLFGVVLPNTKWNVVCRALNGYDEKQLLRTSETKKKNDINDTMILDQLKSMIVQIQGVNDKKVIENAITVMPAGDSKFLRKYYQQVVPTVDMRQPFTCSSCGFEETLEVPLNADFFWFK